jgi:hypothetical protein
MADGPAHDTGFDYVVAVVHPVTSRVCSHRALKTVAVVFSTKFFQTMIVHMKNGGGDFLNGNTGDIDYRPIMFFEKSTDMVDFFRHHFDIP